MSLAFTMWVLQKTWVLHDDAISSYSKLAMKCALKFALQESGYIDKLILTALLRSSKRGYRLIMAVMVGFDSSIQWRRASLVLSIRSSSSSVFAPVGLLSLMTRSSSVDSLKTLLAGLYKMKHQQSPNLLKCALRM